MNIKKIKVFNLTLIATVLWKLCITMIPLMKMIDITMKDSEDEDLKNFLDSILAWISCLSIARQWYLDIEIYPKKYEKYVEKRTEVDVI